MTTTLENDVFAVPEPGEPMTVETIAHDLRVARWTVARAFNALRHNGDGVIVKSCGLGVVRRPRTLGCRAKVPG